MPRGRPKKYNKPVLHDSKTNRYISGKYSLLTGKKVNEYKIPISDTANLRSINVEKLIAKKYHIEEDKIFLESPPFVVSNFSTSDAVEE